MKDYWIKPDMSRTALRDRSSCRMSVTQVGKHSIATLLCGKVKMWGHWVGEIKVDEVKKEDLSVRGLPRGIILASDMTGCKTFVLGLRSARGHVVC